MGRSTVTRNPSVSRPEGQKASSLGRSRVADAEQSIGQFWAHLAQEFKSNSRVIFDTDNEFHDEPGQLVADLNQAAINAIRATGATSQYIAVEGNAWTGAWTWTTVKGTDGLTNAETMVNLKDPNNKILYEVSCTHLLRIASTLRC